MGGCREPRGAAPRSTSSLACPFETLVLVLSARIKGLAKPPGRAGSLQDPKASPRAS